MTRSKKIIIGGFIVVAITFAMAFGCMLGLNLNNQVQTAYALDTISVSNVYYFDGYNDVSFGTTMPTGYTFSDGTLTIADGATPYEILTKGKGNLAVKFEGDYGNNTISISNEVGELTLTSTTPVDVTLAGLYSAEMIHIEGKVNLTITGPSYSGSMDGQYSKFLVGCLYGTLYVEDDASVTAIDPVLHGKTISDTSFEAIFKVGALVLNTTGCFKVGLNSTSTSTDEAYAIKVIDNGFSPVSYSSCDNGFVLYSNANKFICIGDSADDLDYADYQTELEKKLKTIEDGNSLTIRRCQVSFDANTGSGTMDNEMSYKGNYSLPNCSFTAPSGKRFKCWAVGSASGTQYNAGASYTITDDVTFYAVWEDIPRAFTTQPQGIATKEIGQTHQISWAVNFDAVEYGVYFWNGSAWQEMYRYDSAITPAGTVMTYNITHDAAGEMRYNVDCYYTEFDYITSEEFTITWQDNTPAPVVVNGQSPDFSGGDRYFNGSSWIVEPDLGFAYAEIKTNTTPYTLEIDHGFELESLEFNQDMIVSYIYFTDEYEPWVIPSLTTNGHTITFISDKENTVLTITTLTGESTDLIKGTNVEQINIGAPETYTVSFNANGGNGTMDPVNDVSGSYTIPVAVFTRANYYFVGWAFFANGTKISTATINVTEDTELFAIWAPIPVIVNGESPDFGGGDRYFNGTSWSDEQDLGFSYVVIQTSTDPYTLRVDYDFELESLEFNQDMIVNVRYFYDDYVPFVLPTLTTNGHTITFTSDKEDTAITITSLIGDEADLEKGTNVEQLNLGTPITYTVTYYANNETIENGQDSNLPAGEYTLLDISDWNFNTPTGKQFKGWAYSNDGEIIDTETITLDGNKELYAIWEDIPAETYTVTYKPNNETAGVVRNDISAGSYDLEDNHFAAPTGKQFKAWNVNGVEKQPGDSITISENITIIAVWEDVEVETTYTVTYKPNNETAGVVRSNISAGSYDLEENHFAAPTGKQFKAWNVNGTEKQPGDTITISENTTVIAVWEDIPAEEPEYHYEVVDGVNVYDDTLTAGTPKDVSGLFEEAKARNGKVELTAGTLTLTFDADAVNAIGGNNVSLTANVVTENLTIDGAQLVIEVTLNGATFATGKATISVPFNTAVPSGKVAKVYYVNGNEKTDMNAVFEDGKVTFEMTHFSTFAVVFEDEQAAPVDPVNPDPVNPEPSEPEVNPTPEKGGLSGGAIAGIVIGCFFGLLLIACAVLFILHKKGIVNIPFLKK